MITIINYGSGNISAIGNIYERLNVPFKIASHPDDLEGVKKIFLPGVGAFDETIQLLEKTGFREVLDHEVLVNKVPVIGICVGMQVLAEESEEGRLPGLGWIKGTVKKIDKTLLKEKPKLPHLGWNSVHVIRENPLFEGIDTEEGFYFLHSYYFECLSESNVLSRTFYGKDFASAVNEENVYGVQFHPEKSHRNGIQLLENFARL